MSTASRSRLGKKLCILLASSLGSLLCAELLHRGWLIATGSPYDSTEAATEWRRLLDPSQAFVPPPLDEGGGGVTSREAAIPILHPYSGSEWGHDTGGVLAAFRAGFDRDEYTVVVVGGSVAAACLLTRGDLIATNIQTDPRFEGRRVRVLNYAHASFKQPQQLMRMAYLFSLGYRPDAVINLDGFNEVALALQNLRSGTHPVYPPAPVWGSLVTAPELIDDERTMQRARLLNLRAEAESIVSHALAYKLHYSSILGTLTRSRILANWSARHDLLQKLTEDEGVAVDDTAAFIAAFRQARGPDFIANSDSVLAAGAVNWRESSLSLHALCEARGVYYLHVLQPALHDVSSKRFSEQESNLGPAPFGWIEGSRDGYPLLRAETRALEAAGVRWYDATGIFGEVDETIYTDPCHLNPAGQVLLAEALARAFLERLP